MAYGYTIRARTSTAPPTATRLASGVPRQTICSDAKGSLVTVMAQMARGPVDTRILGFNVDHLFCLGACKKFKLRFHQPVEHHNR